MNLKAMAVLFGSLLQACIIGGGGTGGEGLSGSLLDSRGTPIAGAKVGVYSRSGGGLPVDSTFTGANGKFGFSGLAAGRYNVAASVQRQDTILAAFVRDVDLGGKLDLGSHVMRVSGSLQLAVRTSGGAPVFGAQCVVPASPYITVSDTGGTCILEGMAPGSYQVGVVGGDLDTAVTGTLDVESGVAHGVVTIVITAGPGLGGRWSIRSSGIIADLNAVIWSGNKYVAVGNSGSVLLSPDGVSWSASGVQDPDIRLRGAAWTGQQLVSVGWRGQDSGVIFTSPTGTSWTRRASFTEGISAVVWTGPLGKLVAVGEGGSIWTSPDGENWSAGVSGTTMHLSSVAWTDSLIVAVGAGPVVNSGVPGIILTSPDGVTWTIQRGGVSVGSPAFVPSLAHVAWTGHEAVTVGGYGALWTSPDGVMWMEQTGGSPLLATAWTGERLIGLGYYSVDNSGGIWTLEHGTRINRYAGFPYVYLNAAAVRPYVQVVVVGNEGTILTSP